MKHILLPTDFSENAKNAYRFATALAKKFDAKLSVIHVYNPAVELTSFEGIPMQAVAYRNEMINSLEKKLATFINLAPDREEEEFVPAPNLDAAVKEGLMVPSIAFFVEEEAVDLVVMGTKGESDWASKLFGSLTANVINNVSCPVLAVPKNTPLKEVKQISYATSLNVKDKDKIETILNYGKSLGSELKVIYVDDRMVNAGDGRDEDFNREYFYKNIGNSQVPFEIIWAKDITKGIKAYFKDNAVDVIALTRSKFGFWRRLFNQSVTEDLMSEIPFPLLIFHED